MRPFALDFDSSVTFTSPEAWSVAPDTPFATSPNMYPGEDGDTFCSGQAEPDICKEETCAAVTRKTTHPLLIDEDSGLGMETDMADDHSYLSALSIFTEDEGSTYLNDSFTEVTGRVAQFSRTYKSKSAKKKLFSDKRTAELEEDGKELSPSMKKFRKSERSLLKFALTNSPVQQTDDNVHDIIRAVDRLTTEVDLVADGSRDYSLPSVAGKHGDLKSISAETMADVVANMDSNDVMIVDCRYPYEYQGGHIKDAVNLYTKEEVHKLLELTESARPRILVFHCEFSSERGPKMYRFLRSCDRELNKDNYPNLNFPEVYLLEGGYKEFYQNQQAFCEPCGYKPMLHKDHASDLRHFRVKSKSWTGGQQRKHPSKSRLSRSCLTFNS